MEVALVGRLSMMQMFEQLLKTILRVRLLLKVVL